MNKALNNHAELKEQIQVLRQAIKEQEQVLNAGLKKTIDKLNHPAPLIKDLAKDLAKDSDFRRDLLKIVLSAGTNYLGKLIQSPTALDAVSGFVLNKLRPKDNENGLLAKALTLLNRFTAAKKEKS